MVVAWGCGLFARAVGRLVQLPALLCCEAMVWAISFLAFPIRVLSAVDRERKLVRLIAEMQEQMDGLVWENRELEERLQAALKEQDAMEAVLDEMEEEHEDAYAKMDVLETQLKALKEENMRLKEHKGKARWDIVKESAHQHHGNHGNNKDVSSDYSGNKLGKKMRSLELKAGDDSREEEDEALTKLNFLTTTPAEAEAAAAASSAIMSEAVARRRSLFSLGMSLAVGAVAWSADAPCLPLLAGLFAVVGVSMRSCGALRRGGDAVALLSLNWFLLGVLTSPMLPGVARAVVPRAGRAIGPALTWFAATAPL
ncbi:hypothetical protein PR202_gb03666 [Eleusine coracana subsp. coracana]|uniref:Uncharacterized protein n=1 Tax=Eleusine coracana subsp. coracana TaxID=191504 RepID=A0AAV5E1I3_ELECO|nr:hypothetical protein QOZ80_1BG0097380 [Eleusine coracana subsp. coracana]GJN16653.1 hypothetical protein PR202_gb03666 [Eleusine coracana subsp. coracana]